MNVAITEKEMDLILNALGISLDTIGRFISQNELRSQDVVHWKYQIDDINDLINRLGGLKWSQKR